MKKVFILLPLFPIILFSMLGCDSLQEEDTILPPQESAPAESVLESPQARTATAPTGGPTGPVQVNLAMSDLPAFGKPVRLWATFKIREGFSEDLPNTVAQIYLPEGFKLIEGNLSWEGDLVRGKSVKVEAVVMAVETGERSIRAGATQYFPGEKYTNYGGGSEIYTHVFASVGFVDYHDMIPVEVRLSLSDTPSLNKEVELAASYAIRSDYNEDITNAKIQLVLPEGMQLTKGIPEKTSDINLGTSYDIKYSVKVLKTGIFEIWLIISFHESEKIILAGKDVLYIKVSEDDVVISEYPFAVPMDIPEEVPSESPMKEGDITPQPVP